MYPLGHSAQFMGVGSQSLMCNTLFPPPSLYNVLLLAFDNDSEDMRKIHHLGEHLHDVRMLSGSADELLQCQLA